MPRPLHLRPVIPPRLNRRLNLLDLPHILPQHGRLPHQQPRDHIPKHHAALHVQMRIIRGVQIIRMRVIRPNSIEILLTGRIQINDPRTTLFRRVLRPTHHVRQVLHYLRHPRRVVLVTPSTQARDQDRDSRHGTHLLHHLDQVRSEGRDRDVLLGLLVVVPELDRHVGGSGGEGGARGGQDERPVATGAEGDGRGAVVPVVLACGIVREGCV